MKSSAANKRVWLIVAMFCLVAIGTSSFLLYRLNAAAQTYDRLFDREIRNQTSIRLLQVGFKKQVQEWKDILLRGRDPDDLRQYTEAFHQEDRQVGETALALRESVEEPAVKALLDRFIKAHETLDANYAAGLARFTANGMNPFEVDRMLRGQDRAPTDLIDRIASLMSEHTGNQVKNENIAASRALMAFLVVVGLLLVVAVQRVLGANQALAESEEGYRTLVETAPDAIVAVDHHERIIMCNDRAAALHGSAGPAAMLGTHLGNLFAGPPAAQWNGECTLRRQDGTVLPGEVTAAPLYDRQRNQIGRMVVIRDLTESKQAEEARAKLEEHLIQSQKLESVGRLAGGVAHDFNNLLTVINGYSDLLLQNPNTGDAHRRVVQIRNAGRRAAELTQQLLAFSRKQTIQPRALNLNTVVSETEEMFRRLLPESIEMIVQLEPALGRIMADPGQIHQVLVNLLVNARDAMPAGGKLVTETANVDLDAKYAAAHPEVTPGPCVLLTVSDTGAGMDEQVRSHLFEPFFTTKQLGEGTGLGLATVYGIVRQSGGWIWVYSEPGTGTSFKIYFPRVDIAVSQEVVAAKVQQSYQGTETVLVVEDRADVRTLAMEVLESYGYKVLEASDGASALELAARYTSPIELLLTDAVMPGMNGRELSERLHESRPATKVLFMSGYSENVIVHQGVLKPGIAYIAKPMMPEALAAKVRETLGPRPGH
jgi:two-component system, cell cycle sensor histidine kinase and response regulator CckA